MAQRPEDVVVPGEVDRGRAGELRPDDGAARVELPVGLVGASAPCCEKMSVAGSAISGVTAISRVPPASHDRPQPTFRVHMKIGLFFEHQVPRPWDDGDERRVFEQALEQCELADRHRHRLRVGSSSTTSSRSTSTRARPRCSSPRCRSARSGCGSGTASCRRRRRINHPARVAERVATLDLLSGGRVEFGTGESSSEAELGGFGDRARGQAGACGKRGSRVALRCMTETPFTGHAGEYVHDAAAQRRAQARADARIRRCGWRAPAARRSTSRRSKGIGALSFAFFDPEEARHWVDDYYATLAREGGADRRRGERQPRVRHHVPVPSRRGRGDRAAAPRAPTSSATRSRHYYVFGRHRPGRHRPVGGVPSSAGPRRATTRTRSRCRGRERRPARRQGRRGRGRAGCAARWARPTRCATTSAATRTYGVDQVILRARPASNRHEHVMESLELFGREVLPEFLERDERSARRQGRRLAPVIDTALARKPADDHPPLPDRGLRDPRDPAVGCRSRRRRGFHAWLDDYARNAAAGEDVSRRLANPRHDGTQ